MKKLKFIVALCVMCVIGVLFTSCKEENTSIVGRWDAPRYADEPDDIAFVAIFTDENLDLYVIPWGQHMVGNYSLTDGMVNYNITAAYQALTGVTYDENGNMISWMWEAGHLDASTLTLAEGFNWYAMNSDEFERTKEDFGQFEFKINGNTATSSMVGITDLIFYKVE